MQSLLLINTTLNRTSTGRIVDAIGHASRDAGWGVAVAHGPRLNGVSDLENYTVGTRVDAYIHAAWHSRLRDAHGLGSRGATRRFLTTVELVVRPDIIHLHNIHGYYLNYPELFDFIVRMRIPVIWTMHDCWAFTGHCANYLAAGCDGWRHGCIRCSNLGAYPASKVDKAARNYDLKRAVFGSVADLLTVVTPSRWLAGEVRESFLGKMDIRTIRNGIDLDVFRPYPAVSHRRTKIVLGVAAPWQAEKGLDDFIKLRLALDPGKYHIRLVGLSDEQKRRLPAGIEAVGHITDTECLARIYSEADVFVNPTHQDNYPTTALEATACGLPVVTYRVGGSPETVAPETGIVVTENDINALALAVKALSNRNREEAVRACRAYAEVNHDRRRMAAEYLALYEERRVCGALKLAVSK